MERTYTIPLRKAFLKAPTYHRTNRAVKEVREYLQRHTKTQRVLLGEELNKALWARGDSKPPARVTVFVKKEEDVVYAEIAGKEFKKKDFAEKTEEKPQKQTRGLEAAAAANPPPVADENAAEQAAPKAAPKKETKAKPAAKKAAKK